PEVRAKASLEGRRPERSSSILRGPLRGRLRMTFSNKLDGDAAERAEIGMQRVALLGEHHAGERAGEHEMAGLEGNAVRPELVGEPGDAERRVAEHAGGDTGLLDLGIAIHDAADPAQIDFQRT